MQILTICSRVTGILILSGSLGCLKEVKTMDIVLGKNNFQIVFFLIFSNICCRYTLELSCGRLLGEGQVTSWLSFVVSSCEFVTFPLVSLVRCGT